ncbi:MAG: hypothetical protein IJD56_06660 [Peptococcaceae bacterium]|nr:hypothetical protein [Peptococcaceae bacterium]
MVAIRDMVVANDIAEMAALGWFPHEFIVYGCCYIEDGTLYYKVSSQDTELYHFKEECLKKNIYVSPVVELLNRVSVPSGMQDEYMLKTKLKLAKKLQREYDAEFMNRFSLMAEQDGNDSAAELLYNLKHKLIGCFERELLVLVESIIEYAFAQKKLRRATYEELAKWLDYTYSQMEDDVVIQKNFKRTFYGFAYKTETGAVRYFANASEREVYKKKEELYCKGVTSTPILKKVYYYNSQPNLASVRNEFLEVLKGWMDEEYWWYLEQIDEMPAGISGQKIEAMMQNISEQDQRLKDHLLYYKTLWQLR